MPKSFREGIGHSLILGMEITGTEPATASQKGKWDQQADQMIDVLAQSRHPVIRGISALSRGTLKRKQERKHYLLLW